MSAVRNIVCVNTIGKENQALTSNPAVRPAVYTTDAGDTSVPRVAQMHEKYERLSDGWCQPRQSALSLAISGVSFAQAEPAAATSAAGGASHHAGAAGLTGSATVNASNAQGSRCNRQN
jgi:hypothetical protein